MRSLIIWLIGFILCAVFVIELLPRDASPGHHQWFIPVPIPLGTRGVLFLAGGCCFILAFTYLVDKYCGKPRKPN